MPKSQLLKKLLIIAQIILLGFIGMWSMNHLHWIFDLLSNFLFQFAISLTIVGALWLVLRHWLNGTVCMIVGIGLTILCMSKGNTHDPAAEVKLTLSSINVLSENFDSAAFLSYVETHDPDLVYILECTPFWKSVADGALSSEYPYHAAQPQWDNFGIAIYSKLPLVDTEIFDFTDSYFPIISTTIELDEKEIRLFGTHYENPMGSRESRVRNYQIDQSIKYLKDRNESILFFGDFNMTPYSYKYEEIIDELGIYDSRARWRLAPSWPTFFWPLGIPIDHCFVSPDIQVVERNVAGDVGSDHRPLTVKLSW